MVDVLDTNRKAMLGRSDSAGLPDLEMPAGFVDPLVGRIARRDVPGYFGFPLIRAGETVTQSTADRALQLGRLFELTAATEDF